jgi:DNA-binding winged helix-turn-helix (wHTH) protein
VTAIVLAQEPAFAIGPVDVIPEIRSLCRAGYRDEVVEPRVMQVLVALNRAEGHVVARDYLVEHCWDGRIVGDDAITRVIARLRRMAEGIGRDAFVIETVTKVGYRLRRIEPAFAADIAALAVVRSTPASDRRGLLVGGVALIAAAAIGGGWFATHRPYRPKPRTVALMEQALIALRQATREGQMQAVGLYRQVVTEEPQYPDGWGALAMTFAIMSHYRATALATALQDHARKIAARAFALEPGNAFADVAVATAEPTVGHWKRCEVALRSALDAHPHHEQLLFALSELLALVGRVRDALIYSGQLVTMIPPTPGFLFERSRLLWSAGRLDEADALLTDAARLYPTHFAVWFSRFYTMIFSGRANAALALAADRAQLPSGIPEDEIASVVRVARAIATRSPPLVDAVVQESMKRARTGAGHAENSAQFLASLGRGDLALDILDAYYFGEGFVVPEVRFTASQGTYTPANDRLTAFLFGPSLAPIRDNARFDRLLERLGLNAYWRASGNVPDYRTRPV